MGGGGLANQKARDEHARKDEDDSKGEEGNREPPEAAFPPGLACARFRALAAIANQPAVHPTDTKKHAPLAIAVAYKSALMISE